MFLQVSVILLMGRCVSKHALQVVSQHALQQVSRRGCLLLGGVCSGGCLIWGVSAPGGCLLQGVSAPGRGVCSRGVSAPGAVCSGGSVAFWSRPTPKGEIDGDQVQADTQGGNWGGSGPGPHPRVKLRGFRSRLTLKGEIEGDQVQAHTQGGNWGGSDLGPHPRGNWGGSDPGLRPTPPETQTVAYGQWVAGTHPTGMHSCLFIASGPFLDGIDSNDLLYSYSGGS